MLSEQDGGENESDSILLTGPGYGLAMGQSMNTSALISSSSVRNEQIYTYASPRSLLQAVSGKIGCIRNSPYHTVYEQRNSPGFSLPSRGLLARTKPSKW